VLDCQQVRQMCLADTVGAGASSLLAGAAVDADGHSRVALRVGACTAGVTSFTAPKSARAALHRPFR